MRILDFKRRPDGLFECCLEDEKGKLIFGIDVFVQGPIQGMNFREISLDDTFRIYDCPNSRELFRQIFRLINGEQVEFPMTLPSINSASAAMNAKAAG